MIKRKNLTSAEIVGHSKHAKSGKEIVTLILTLPRIVLAELNTHRAFSRNSGSSRAIPYKRMKQSVKKNLFIPLAFQKHHKGMQGTEYYKTGSFMDRLLIFLWWFASRMALLTSGFLHMFGATKQLANRILEPFMWHTVVITATEWEGFYRQRCPKYKRVDWDFKTKDFEKTHYRSWSEYVETTGLVNFDEYHPKYQLLTERLLLNENGAEIHISLAAEAIYDAIRNNIPVELKEGEFHIPFEKYIHEHEEPLRQYLLSQSSYGYGSYPPDDIPEEAFNEFYSDLHDLYIKVSTAICAMVSFTEVGGKSLVDKMNPEANIKLHDRLIKDEHMSPTEHCAVVVSKLGPGQHSNFKGNWLQYRKIVEKDLIR